MRAIYKYPLSLSEDNEIQMPKGVRIVHFSMQDGVPHIWVDVHTENPPETRHLAIHGTGHPIGSLSAYHGTVHDGPFVWHLYDKDGYP